jgi:hypothetical protein
MDCTCIGIQSGTSFTFNYSLCDIHYEIGCDKISKSLHWPMTQINGRGSSRQWGVRCIIISDVTPRYQNRHAAYCVLWEERHIDQNYPLHILVFSKFRDTSCPMWPFSNTRSTVTLSELVKLSISSTLSNRSGVKHKITRSSWGDSLLRNCSSYNNVQI